MVKGSESKRVRAFQRGLVNKIPRFPNDKGSLTAIQSASLVSLLIHYMNWAIRYVPARPRIVRIDSTASSDARWKKHQEAISLFLDKVTSGGDLTPYLSLEVHSRGYTPPQQSRGSSPSHWADKDFVLTIMGYYHFHLGPNLEPNGFATRTDDLIFAKVTRDEFLVIAVLDHSAFEMTGTDDKMTEERKRLWTIFDEHSTRGLPPGSVYIPAMITTSGHSLHIVRLAQEYANIIRSIDPKLDEQSYIVNLYRCAGAKCPKKTKLAWHLNFLNFGLLDTQSNMFFVFKYGLA
jgi:hypothetical protein